MATAPTAPFHAHAFDATNMLFDAIEKVAVVEDDGTHPYPAPGSARRPVRHHQGMEGITGTMTCDENGDCADPKISVNQVENGEFVRIWP